jgi:hypothetical protein
MTEDIASDDASATEPELRRLVTPADLQAVDLEAPIRGLDLADAHEFYMAYQRAHAAALAANDEACQLVYRLFGDLCGIMLQSSDTGNVWCPIFVLANGSRSAIPEDFREEQTATLAAVVSRIENPALRARIADIAWSNNRRDGASAAAAIDAYCDSVAGLLDGGLKTRHGQAATYAARPALHRAIQIAKLSTKRTKRPEKVGQIFEALYDAAREKLDVSTFVKVAEMGMSFGLRQPVEVALELEAVAAAVTTGTYPMAIKEAWVLAAHLYYNLDDKAGRQRCLIASMEQTLAMRHQVSSPQAAAGWVSDALQQIRHIEGMDEREQELEIELRGLQKVSLKQMGTFTIDLKVGEARETITEKFSTLNLSDALRTFALLSRSRDPVKLREEALENARKSPLMAMMSFVHVDSEGRTESKSKGAPHYGEPDETWFRRMIGQSERMYRAHIVAGAIDPARVVIQARFGIAERHFSAIVGLSAFVPDSQKPIMALGFTRFFQGDMMSATHLLMPQLEPCLRHLLRINGLDPSKRRDDSTEEDHSLGGLYFHFRTELEQILTPRIASEIDLLFNAKPGPELRHEFAHGKISAGACFHKDMYYTNWFIYHLCCLLVLPSWDETVTPQLAEDE